MSFSALPIELKLQIFSNLDHPSLFAMSQVSQECRELARDRTLDNPLIDPQVLDNLLNKNYTLTETPLNIPFGNNQYLHLVNGEPVISPCNNVGYADFSANIDAKTLLTQPIYGTIQKKIQIGDQEYRYNFNALYAGDQVVRYSVKDIAYFHGNLIYIDLYHEGIFLFDPNEKDAWSNKRTKIADNVRFNQIVSDEKNGVIYGVTDHNIVKLDYKNAEPKLKTSSSEKVISYIGRLILKSLGNLIFSTIYTFKTTWKAHAIGASIAFLGGIVLGLALGATNVIIAGVALLILAEMIAIPTFAAIGLITGIGLTVEQILTDKI